MGFFDKLKKITSNLFSGFTEADEDFFEELEETLIMADLGVDAARFFSHRHCTVSRFLPHPDAIRLGAVAVHGQAPPEPSLRQLDDLIRVLAEYI